MSIQLINKYHNQVAKIIRYGGSHKARKPRDPTIREKFNTYRCADYKEHVIDLLTRVCTVSVETINIINQMPSEIVNLKSEQ